MVYVVDTIEVDPPDAEAYFHAIETMGVPVMTEAGARFVSCWGTSPELGEDVNIKTIWSCDDHAQWNVIRKNLVLDPRWHAFAATIAGLWKGGQRRFFYPSSFSPSA